MNTVNGSETVSLSPSATNGDFVVEVIHLDQNFTEVKTSVCVGTF